MGHRDAIRIGSEHSEANRIRKISLYFLIKFFSKKNRETEEEKAQGEALPRGLHWLLNYEAVHSSHARRLSIHN